jgi:hypothetical protein
MKANVVITRKTNDVENERVSEFIHRLKEMFCMQTLSNLLCLCIPFMRFSWLNSACNINEYFSRNFMFSRQVISYMARTSLLREILTPNCKQTALYGRHVGLCNLWWNSCFCGTPKLIILFTRARHWIYFLASSSNFTSAHHTSVISTLKLLLHLLLGLEQWFSNVFGSRRTVKYIKMFWRTSCIKLKKY